MDLIRPFENAGLLLLRPRIGELLLWAWTPNEASPYQNDPQPHSPLWSAQSNGGEECPMLNLANERSQHVCAQAAHASHFKAA